MADEIEEMCKYLKLTEAKRDLIEDDGEIPTRNDVGKAWLIDYVGEFRLEDYRFTEAAFWVRIYDLPLGKRTKEMAAKIGRAIGQLQQVDPSSDLDGWASFLRVPVSIDITKPLSQAVVIKGAKDGLTMMGRLAYERLPTFCSVCGHLGHSFEDCILEDGLDANDPQIHQYGEWLKASPLKWKAGAGAGGGLKSHSMFNPLGMVQKEVETNMGWKSRRRLFPEGRGKIVMNQVKEPVSADPRPKRERKEPAWTKDYLMK